jgi:inositol transport system ATP-binding protein
MAALLDMAGITKSFPGVRALDRVSFSVEPGEVVGLLGENGAGKSTLMKVLSGVYHADAGQVTWEGKPVAFRTIQEAQQAGISLIFQELNNCPNLKPVDNLFLGRELYRKSGFLDYPAMRRKARELFDHLGVEIDLDLEVHRFSTAVQQMIEIGKALLTNVKLLVMDEPTSSLSDKETARLFRVIRELKARGTAVVFISHKLNEVFQITDRIVVLRDGQNAGALDSHQGTIDQLISLMVGRDLGSFASEHRTAAPGDELLRVEGLSGGKVQEVSFTLRKGEILGVAGLIGSGRTEMARLLLGADRKAAGRVLLEGREARIRNPRDAVAAGFGFVPEDRKVQALILPMSVRENLTMAIHGLVRRLRAFLSRKKENAVTDQFVSALRIKVSGREQAVKNLSGGNQQKVVIAKWLATRPRILVLDEPTRGIDVAAKAEVHRIVAELADQGVAILLISSELPEILALSDRVLVMHEGKAKAVLDRGQASQETIMSAALASAAR